MKSVLFPKTLPIPEIQAVRIGERAEKKGSAGTVYEIILKEGDSFTLPSLTHMAGFMEKLTLLGPHIEIKDERSRKKLKSKPFPMMEPNGADWL